jgi:GWxTD domain-containing protein
MRNLLAVCALSVVALSASAEMSPDYKAWRESAVQWLMTPDEQKAWKSVRSDAEASAFIDLFWARRDPTPNTPKNEYYELYLGYEKFADANYGEARKRGSLTERGRVLIVLGEPTTGVMGLGGSSHHSGVDSMVAPDDGNRLQGQRLQWEWSREAALEKFGMPRVIVVFTEVAGTGRIVRDPSRPDFIGASREALKRAIKNPELTEAPAWALRGGLKLEAPKTLAAAPVAPAAPAPAVPAPENEGPALAGMPLTRLTLLRDPFLINPQTKADPFATLNGVGAFKAEEELGWVSQYCTGSEDEPTVRFTLRLTGTAANEVIDRLAPPDELVPDRIKAAPGCYMMRGSIPLEGMLPGDYALEVNVEDPATRMSYAVKQDFRIE